MRKIKKPARVIAPGLTSYPTGAENEVVVQSTPVRIAVSGYAVDDIQRVIDVEVGERSTVMLISDFADGGRRARDKLARAGTPIITNEIWKTLLGAVDGIKAHPIRAAYLHSGHVPNGFVRPHGVVHVREGTDPGLVAFEKMPGKCGQAGDLAAWQREVAAPCAAHHLLAFAVMAPLAAVLMQSAGIGPVGFALTTSDPTDRMLLTKLAAGVAGNPGGEPNERYSTGLLQAVDQPSVVLAVHRDMPLVIEGLTSTLPGKTAKAAGDLRDAFFHQWAGCGGTSGLNHVDSRCLIVTACAPDELPDLTARLADKLLIIPVSPERSLGVLNTLVTGVDSKEQLITDLTRAATQHFGVALAAFVDGWVAGNKKGGSFAVGVKRRLAAFRAHVGTDINGPAPTHVVDAFGLVGAAGEFAKRVGVLPREFDAFEAAAACYRAYRAAAQPPQSLIERLKALIARDGVVDVSHGTKLSLEELKSAPALTRLNKAGDLQVLFFPEAIERAFGNTHAFLSNREIAGVIDSGMGSHKGKRVSLPGGPNLGRVYIVSLGQE